MITSFAFQRKNKSLVAVDAVEEKDGKMSARTDKYIILDEDGNLQEC